MGNTFSSSLITQSTSTGEGVEKASLNGRNLFRLGNAQSLCTETLGKFYVIRLFVDDRL